MTIGSFDGAETCELVGLFILSQLRELNIDVGLYRDDGLAISQKNTKANRAHQETNMQFSHHNSLKMTIEANKSIVDFLDVTFNIACGTYKPYLKPNNTPKYVHTESNHPPTILKNIPESINRKINNISATETDFNEASKIYQEALDRCGYNHKLKFESYIKKDVPPTCTCCRNSPNKNFTEVYSCCWECSHKGKLCFSVNMAFFELMRKRRRVSEEALSEGSEAMLKDALSQLITYHQDFNKLLSETTSLCKVQNQPGRDSASDSVCVNLCLTFLCQEALTLGRDVAVHSAESCATTLLKLVKMDECINMNLETLMKIMKQMIQNNTFSVDHFVGVLFKEPVISLEILWQLHKEDICSIDALLSVKWSHKSFVDMLSTQLTSALTQQLDTTGTSVCISDIIGCLVTIGFSENKEVTAVTKTAIAILDRINKELLDQQNDGIGLVFPISVVTTNITIPKVTLKKFSTVCLSSFMSYNPVHKVSRAIKDQAQWTYAKTPVSLQHFFKQILLQFDPDEVIADLQQILDNKEVNWQMVLSFTSTLLVCVPLATQLMQDYISRLLREGLEGTDMEKTIVGFLFARQACYEGPHAFPSYQEWFQVNRSSKNNNIQWVFIDISIQ
ncbi:hypothetical protein ScPMuIL_001887 [Solemya velum]